jgi:subtilisin family serine protease
MLMKNLLATSLLTVLFSTSVMASSGSQMVLLKGSVKQDSTLFSSQVEALGGTVTYFHRKAGIALVSGLDDAGVAALAGSSVVQEIAPEFSIELDPGIQNAGSELVEQEIASPADPTTATRYSRQWNMRAIDADLAWAAGRLGSSAVTVAIIDTGIDYNYVDLQGRVDLSRSASFLPDDDVLVDIYFPGAHHVADLHYHGTHVASTVVSNSTVVAGVTTQTTLIGVKVCSVLAGVGCPSGAVLGGLLHAADNGADVANMSLGGGFLKAGAQGYGGFLNRVFNYVHSVGMTVVVSAGNEGLDLDHYPNLYKTYCTTPSTICVSATGPTAQVSVDGPWTDVDALASYSNYGRSAVNVAAPGGNVSAVWAACSGFTTPAAAGNTSSAAGAAKLPPELTVARDGTAGSTASTVGTAASATK